MVAGAQVATIFGVTVLNIALTRYLHDAMPSTVRAGASSVVSTIGYAAFVPTALGFGVYSRSHGIFAASVFVVVPLAVMCAAVACARRWRTQPAASPPSSPSATAGPGPAPGTSPGLRAADRWPGPARARYVRDMHQRPLLVARRPGPSAGRGRAEGEPGRGAREIAGVQGMAATRAPGGWSRDRLGRQRGAGPAAARGP